MTTPDVRAAHLEHVASLTDADLRSTATNDDDGLVWPQSRWMGGHHRYVPPVEGREDDDLDDLAYPWGPIGADW